MNGSKHDRAERRALASGRQPQADIDAAHAQIRKTMALEERNREEQAARRMRALYQSTVLHPGHFSHWRVQRQQLIDASRELRRIAER